MKKFFNLITLSLLIKQQDRNFPFIFHVFSNQYYSFESNTPLHSRRYGGKTNAAKVIAPIHNLYLISVTSERMLDFSNKVLPSTFQTFGHRGNTQFFPKFVIDIFNNNFCQTFLQLELNFLQSIWSAQNGRKKHIHQIFFIIFKVFMYQKKIF